MTVVHPIFVVLATPLPPVLGRGVGNGLMKSIGNTAVLAWPPVSKVVAPVPSPPVLGGRGVGVRGDSIPRENVRFLHSTCPPHPQPLSPEYRGEGSGQRNENWMNDAIGFHQPSPGLI